MTNFIKDCLLFKGSKFEKLIGIYVYIQLMIIILNLIQLFNKIC